MDQRTTATKNSRSYLSAAGHDWFLPFYDLITKWIGGDEARRLLVRQAELRPGYHVLDVGCGTGTLAVEVKRIYPEVEIVGLDPDPKALRRAKEKAESASISARFDQGFADALAFPTETFDRVFSSFMFHHVERENKPGMLREIRRVLKPGGSFHLLDFAGSHHGAGLVRLFHAEHRLADNDESLVVSLMEQAGFADVEILASRKVLFGLSRAVYYRAMR